MALCYVRDAAGWCLGAPSRGTCKKAVKNYLPTAFSIAERLEVASTSSVNC